MKTSLVNIFVIAFSALVAEQVIHETVHGITALIVGADWVELNFWASYSEWPKAVNPGFWPSLAIPASAALFNILCAFVCIVIFRGGGLASRPLVRLFVFFFGAYSLFSGFGYLFFDPIFARAGSLGDWARVTMMFGGGWEVRIPIITVGAVGTVYGYFWMGRAAQYFRAPLLDPDKDFKKLGLMLCIWPYLGVNLLFTVFSFWHPVGTGGMIAANLKLWMGFIGFFWAFMIRFVWMPPAEVPAVELSALPQGLSKAWSAAALLAVILIALVLLPGIKL